VRGPPARHPEEQKEQLPAVEGIIQDASELKPGDRVVYPNQGVCGVVGTEELEVAGGKYRMVKLRREEDGSFVSVAVAKVPTVGLRRVASGDQIEGVFHYLAASFDEPELDWKVRHRDNVDRLIAGGVLGVAEVVKGLHSLSRIRPLPTKEREVYDNARHLLVHEVAVSLAVPPALAEDYVDYALMPPEGVKFQLKPPPKPVLLPSRPRRRPVVAEEGADELGLDELGLPELPDEAEVVPAVEGEVVAPAAEEGEAEGAEGGGEEAAPARPPPARKEKAPAAARKKEKAPARPAPKKEKPAAKKAAPARKPAKAPAPKKKAAARPAPKRGGKKK
jgi:RNA polymerase-interacting CarD/CdnL/TRCF family regulator